MKGHTLRSKVRRLLQGSSRGLTLVELVIAMALMGIIVVALLGGLSNAIVALHFADVQATAESLARSEMEYLKQSYNATAANYTDNAPLGYEGYAVSVGFWCLDEDETLQRVTVEVSHKDRPDPVVTLTGYRADR